MQENTRREHVRHTKKGKGKGKPRYDEDMTEYTGLDDECSIAYIHSFVVKGLCDSDATTCSTVIVGLDFAGVLPSKRNAAIAAAPAL